MITSERYLTNKGYLEVYAPAHPRARRNGRVFEHILVVEESLGHHLPPVAVVHHVNENKTDNRPDNLVACQDQPYHLLLHRRARALRECGDPNHVQCWYCKAWDAPVAMTPRSRTGNGLGQYHHRKCAAEWQRSHHAAKGRQSRQALVDARRARSACASGHLWTDRNTRINKAGIRICRVCESSAWKERRALPTWADTLPPRPPESPNHD